MVQDADTGTSPSTGGAVGGAAAWAHLLLDAVGSAWDGEPAESSSGQGVTHAGTGDQSPLILCCGLDFWVIVVRRPCAARWRGDYAPLSRPPSAPAPSSRHGFQQAVCVLLVVWAAFMSGLTVALLSLDEMNMKIIEASGTAYEVACARLISPLLERRHLLLVASPASSEWPRPCQRLRPSPPAARRRHPLPRRALAQTRRARRCRSRC